MLWDHLGRSCGEVLSVITIQSLLKLETHLEAEPPRHFRSVVWHMRVGCGAINSAVNGGGWLPLGVSISLARPSSQINSCREKNDREAEGELLLLDTV